MLDNAAGGPGQPGQSMKDGAAGGLGAPAQSMNQAAAGGPGQPLDGGGKGKAEAELVPGEKKAGKPDPELKTGEPGKKPGEQAGATGGPGAAGGPGKPGAKDDEDDLVDPNADRPNFGGAGPNIGEAEGEGEEEAAEFGGAFASIAARAAKKGGKDAKQKAERKPPDPAFLTLGIMAAAVMALGLLVWLGREILSDVLPGISNFYHRIGMEAPREGEGLTLTISSKSSRRIDGVQTLVVKGYISNIGEIPRKVPKLRLELYSDKKEVIQDMTVSAPKTLLDPAGTVDFEIRLPLLQLDAAKGGFAVVWSS